jgi:hypothetical protein
MARYTRTYGDYEWLACKPGEMFQILSSGAPGCGPAPSAVAIPTGAGSGTRAGVLPSGRYQTTDCPSGWSYIGPSVDGITSPPAVCVAPSDLASTPLPVQAGAAASKTWIWVGAAVVLGYFFLMRKGASAP